MDYDASNGSITNDCGGCCIGYYGDKSNSTISGSIAPGIGRHGDGNITIFQATEIVCTRYRSTAHVVFASVSLATITLATIVGNLLVIASVFRERSLRTVANCLIVSLAVADLLVALLVMPVSAVYQIEGCWLLGPTACNLWVFFDVLCCTSSIYHLVAISFDRLWAVTSCEYIHHRSFPRILVMITLSWGLSAVICVPPLLGWTSPHGSNLAITGECLISQDMAYTIFSTAGAFYLPLVTIMITYAQVYRKARERILRKHFANRESDKSAGKPSLSNSSSRKTEEKTSLKMARLRSSEVTMETTLVLSNADGKASDHAVQDGSPRQTLGSSPETLGKGMRTSAPSTLTLCATPSGSSSDLAGIGIRGRSGSLGTRYVISDVERRSWNCRGHSPVTREKTLKRRIERKRERKAARTLTVVTGTFICCWLPFFVVATLRPACGQRCHFPDLLTSVILWLGYINSLLNPMIYTLFNPDFRTAFRKILLGKCSR